MSSPPAHAAAILVLLLLASAGAGEAAAAAVLDEVCGRLGGYYVTPVLCASALCADPSAPCRDARDAPAVATLAARLAADKAKAAMSSPPVAVLRVQLLRERRPQRSGGSRCRSSQWRTARTPSACFVAACLAFSPRLASPRPAKQGKASVGALGSLAAAGLALPCGGSGARFGGQGARFEMVKFNIVPAEVNPAVSEPGARCGVAG
ncbi:antifreeze protein Maxi-like [Panicum miliaceum]|uniref:Antifreeze protein Maxi-like n=1 Tax=Panicum miliaceum TaxID=4540 RepID=A0A3L6S1A7_PANMI|nr:antifreeze protein Maxi-like [Panicum miliaceum]